MDDKPGTVPCPHCGANAERLPVIAGDRRNIRCPTCGDYSISRPKQTGSTRVVPIQRRRGSWSMSADAVG
jgi:endogenous inhibitor of DNA gyrase (YacG/DUF329 family)